MHYWDASALVPLCLQERESAVLRQLAAGEEIVTWCLSAVEIASALERRFREGALSAKARHEAFGNLAELADHWHEVDALAEVRERAFRLLAVHSLRAADGLQLAAGLVAAFDRPAGHRFVSLDGRLRQAPAREGFGTGP